MSIKIILAGPRGKMGTSAVNMILNNEKFELVACLDHRNDNKKLSDILPQFNKEVPIYTDMEQLFKEVSADVFVDLTIPEVGYKHTLAALENNLRPVVGTSGFSNEQIDTLSKLAKEKKLGGIIAPNFAIGAVLMMEFSKQAARYFPDVEIIEKHHDNKVDAPSGTAMKTLELIKNERIEKSQGHPEEFEIIKGARGAESEGVHVHSIRLPGLVAHQEVIFGGKSQLLTIKHDSFDRESFMDGIALSINAVLDLEELVYGLEHIL
ncbi:MAG TPA: 4-hydroxy-tetrahydrodipicolinate reductase [Pseudogracilibacillus sp.]|nr:4-hydroxy-tetrahydrodipicolinate reductase [Pseudogracilibacillus sp.]